MHIYDTSTDEVPPPCLRLIDSRRSSFEGIAKAMFIAPPSSSSSAQLISGGNHGTITLWHIPSGNETFNEILSSGAVDFRMKIVHRTPRIHCFNSSKERLPAIGGMGLQYSLPEEPIPSTDFNGTILLGDVKQMHYILPLKDKYVSDEVHGNLTTQIIQSKSSKDFYL